MKNIFKVLIASFGFSSLCGFATIAPAESENIQLSCMTVKRADDSVVDGGETTETPSKPCQVVIEKTSNGTIETDITEGEIGDIVTVTAKHDLLYKVQSVSVNGVDLIESETTRGLYSFALVEGENKITAKFVVDEELCGDLTNIIQQATNEDWTNLFTIENVVTLVKWLLDGGILIAMVRYFIKDKKLSDKVEKKVTESCEKIIPESTKNAVVENTKYVIEPMFNEVVKDGALSRQLMAIMVKCMVLMQQNTPEAKIAILDEFEKLKGVVDLESIANIKRYIEETVANHSKAYEETLNRINKISEQHQENLEEEKGDEVAAPSEQEQIKEETNVPSKDDGTQI